MMNLYRVFHAFTLAAVASASAAVQHDPTNSNIMNKFNLIETELSSIAAKHAAELSAIRSENDVTAAKLRLENEAIAAELSAVKIELATMKLERELDTTKDEASRFEEDIASAFLQDRSNLRRVLAKDPDKDRLEESEGDGPEDIQDPQVAKRADEGWSYEDVQPTSTSSLLTVIQAIVDNVNKPIADQIDLILKELESLLPMSNCVSYDSDVCTIGGGSATNVIANDFVYVGTGDDDLTTGNGIKFTDAGDTQLTINSVSFVADVDLNIDMAAGREDFGQAYF